MLHISSTYRRQGQLLGTYVLILDLIELNCLYSLGKILDDWIVKEIPTHNELYLFDKIQS